MENNQPEAAEPIPSESARKSLWEIISKTPGSAPDTSTADASAAVETIDQPQSFMPEPLPNESRELPEAKLLKQLSEMTQLLEQQTSILLSQQKLLENMAGQQKARKKRKSGVKHKIKTIIHKGKLIWSIL